MQAGVVMAQVVCVRTGSVLLLVLNELPAVDALGAVCALGPFDADTMGKGVHFELQAAIGAIFARAANKAPRLPSPPDAE